MCGFFHITAFDFLQFFVILKNAEPRNQKHFQYIAVDFFGSSKQNSVNYTNLWYAVTLQLVCKNCFPFYFFTFPSRK